MEDGTVLWKYLTTYSMGVADVVRPAENAFLLMSPEETAK